MEHMTSTLTKAPVRHDETAIKRPATGAGSQKPKSAEMHPGPGFRLKFAIERPDADLVARFAAFDTPFISDHLNRLFTMSTAIQLLTDPAHRLLGPACTVKVFPGDNLMVHKALDIARPGDVLVIDASASSLTAVLGDLVSTKARHRGIAGVVLDGLIRDLPAIRKLVDFPVFARGVTPIGPLHRGPGEVNYPVSAGGIVVSPGDIIVGDLNGVVVVPRDVAASVVARIEVRAAIERDYQAAVARGDFSNAWVDDYLQAAGVRPDLLDPYELPDPAR